MDKNGLFYQLMFLNITNLIRALMEERQVAKL